MAEDLVINPNTVVRAYRDLESEGIVELRHGSGVFVRESVAGRASVMKKAEPIVRSAVERLESLDLTGDEIRRLLENELGGRRAARGTRKRRACSPRARLVFLRSGRRSTQSGNPFRNRAGAAGRLGGGESRIGLRPGRRERCR